MNLINDLGLFFKENRERCGFTRVELAGKIGVEKSYIGKMERGEFLPSKEVIIAICSVLNLDNSLPLVSRGYLPLGLHEKTVAALSLLPRNYNLQNEVIHLIKKGLNNCYELGE